MTMLKRTTLGLSIAAAFGLSTAVFAEEPAAMAPAAHQEMHQEIHKEGHAEAAAEMKDAGHAAAPAHHAPHWSYEGEGGPVSWGKLDEKFALCETGKQQSPIDISAANVTTLDNIEIHYAASPLSVKNNGHTIQVNYAPGSTIKVGDAQYDLLQFHFHTPSEESIGGKRYDMVAHFVHKTADGKLGVIGLLLKVGAENAALKAVFDNMPAEAEKENTVADAQVNAADALPKNLTYFNFAGSLTTPPCSEGVNWMVLANPAEISQAQLDAFRKLFPMNARPIQPVNGRIVRLAN